MTFNTTVDDINPALPTIRNIPQIPSCRVLKVMQGLYHQQKGLGFKEHEAFVHDQSIHDGLLLSTSDPFGFCDERDFVRHRTPCASCKILPSCQHTGSLMYDPFLLISKLSSTERIVRNLNGKYMHTF